MKADATMEQLQEEFTFTLSRFSHEIRNPIALISSELQLIADSSPEVTTYKNWEDLMENLDYVKELLTELSDYSNAGRLSLTDTDMHDFLNRIAASLKPTLDYLGISMETRLSPALPVLPVDQVKLKQALLNLLRNAQESISHSRGQICLGAAAYHNGIRITIEDNGCGIPAEKLSDIFLPFVTTKPTGSGLGLAVTRQIIEAHRGSIQVESTPGQGTCFRIFLG